jgi:hypothetical protein
MEAMKLLGIFVSLQIKKSGIFLVIKKQGM